MGNLLSYAAPLASLENASPLRRPESRRIPHVCIVGAGMSGLRAADVLLRRGVQVTVFEARNRTGGRLHQSSKLGHLVDLGPNWIHGASHNPFVRLAKETHSVTHNFGDLHSIFDCKGTYMDPEAAKEQAEAVWDILDDGLKYSKENSALISPTKSLMNFFEERVKEQKLPDERSRNMLDHARMWGAMIGTEIQRQSFKFLFLEEVIDGGKYYLLGKRNVNVATEALDGATVHFSTPITSFRHHLATTGELDYVEVETDKGTKFKFDEVIVTAPLGWIKQNKDSFTPPIPKGLSQAIDNIGYGCLEKVWVNFPTAFWSEFPGETLLLRPEYAPESNPQCWNQEFVSLAALPAPYTQPTIMFYIYGDNSKTITSRITSLEPHSRDYYNALNDFFKPYYSRLPGFSDASADCIPKAFECTDWQHDRWAGNGSYSNFQIGLKHADEDVETYRRGMGLDRGIWFAGEATAPFVALGTVTGAYWSGEAVAKSILKLYDLADKETDEVEIEIRDVQSGSVLGEAEIGAGSVKR